jgi:hypothetical protein
MNRTRALPLALLSTLCAAPLATAGEAPAGAITVPTEAVPPPKPGPGDGALRALPNGSSLDLDVRAPAGFAAPPAGTRPALWAEWKVGGKPTTVALVRGAGDALTAYADANGDRKFDPAEGTDVPPAAGRASARAKNWEIEAWKVGDAKAALVATETVPGLAGDLVFRPAKSEKNVRKRIEFADAKPASVTKAEDVGERVRWASTQIGEKTIVVMVTRGAGHEALVTVDANGDGELAVAERHAVTGKPTRRGAPSGPVETKVTWEVGPVAIEGLDVRMVLTDTAADVRANVIATSVRKGTVDVEGVPHAVFLTDGDFDGKFTGADDFWWFGKVRAPDPNGRNDLIYAKMFEATEAAFEGGKAWRLASVGADGTATVAPAPAVDVEAYFHARGERVNAKRWFPRFDLEASFFSEDMKLDLSRPKASARTAWHHDLDIDAAIARAAKEGKPLLVDFEADWCVWCKRLDYYTYPDREVAEWLAKFSLAKVNLDFETKDARARWTDADGQPLNKMGIPMLAVLDGEGRPVTFRSTFTKKTKYPEEEERDSVVILGFAKPERFVQNLKSAYAAWERARSAGPTKGGN